MYYSTWLLISMPMWSSSAGIDLPCHQIILDNEIENIEDAPPPPKSIFFIETSCESYQRRHGVHLSALQACAVESAARKNPKHAVYVLFAAPVRANATSKLTNLLLRLNNVFFRRIIKTNLSRKSPVHRLVLSGMNSSEYPVHHTSDVLRILTLWRYPGVYLDLDIISLRGLKHLPRGNWVSAESCCHLNNAALALDASRTGRRIARKTLKEMSKTFRPDKWSYNGLGALERVLRPRCHWPRALEFVVHPSKCKGIKILDPKLVFPVPFNRLSWLFNQDLDTFEESGPVEPSDSIRLKGAVLLHAWDEEMKRQGKSLERLPLATPLAIIAREFCPTVYNFAIT